MITVDGMGQVSLSYSMWWLGNGSAVPLDDVCCLLLGLMHPSRSIPMLVWHWHLHCRFLYVWREKGNVSLQEIVAVVFIGTPPLGGMVRRPCSGQSWLSFVALVGTRR